MYDVRFYSGDYYERQMAANADNAAVYVEHHFNASGSENANYTCVVVGSNSSQKSRDMADKYSDLVSEILDVPEWDYDNDPTMDGVVVGGFGGRGNYNVKFTKMPAMLVEPLFASNPKSALVLASEEGRMILAEILATVIREFFPDESLVAFSVGHKYKRNRPHDRGAAVAGEDQDPTDDIQHVEADYAEDVLQKAAYILENDIETSLETQW